MWLRDFTVFGVGEVMFDCGIVGRDLWHNSPSNHEV